MKKIKFSAWAVLFTIALVAGLLLAVTNSMTKPVIDQQSVIAAENSRAAVLPAAQTFVEIEVAEGAQVDWCYAGMAGEELVGYVAQATVGGFNADIEVIIGMDTQGLITGVSVGGASFSETAGLGEKTRSEEFRSQYIGKVAPLRVIKAGQPAGDDTIDSVTAATISSTAVNGAVNTIADYIFTQDVYTQSQE